MSVPVVIFVYNRPEHTKRTIEALADNYLAKDTNVFIFSDASKNEKSEKEVEITREFIDTLPEKKLFKNIEIIKASRNLGLANSVIMGVNEIIGRYGKLIVLEDDLITSKDFLLYMNNALDYYEKNEDIWSISGYNIPIDIPKNYTNDVYLSYRGCSWGWATWKDRWNKVDWNVLDYHEFKNSKKLRKKLNRGGRDMANMLDLQVEGKIDSWAIRWCYTQSKLEMYTVYPVKTRIKNIGLDGSGTHSGLSSHYDVDFSIDNEICNFDNVKINKEITKKFQNHYMNLLDYYLIKPKKVVKKILRRSLMKKV